MRVLKPLNGANVTNMERYVVRLATNGAATPTVVAGGRGMLCSYTAVGTYTIKMIDAPTGPLVGWDANYRLPASTDEDILVTTWNSTTYTLTIIHRTASTRVTSEWPAAATDKELHVELIFASRAPVS